MNPLFIPTVVFALAIPAFSEPDPGNPFGEVPPLEPFEKPFSIRLEEPTALPRFIARIQEELAGENLNVIIAPDAQDIEIPPINLRNVSLIGVLETLGPICGIMVNHVSGVRDPVEGILAIASDGGIKTETFGTGTSKETVVPQPPMVVRAFPIRTLGPKNVDRLEALISSSWELHVPSEGGSDGRPTISFSADSGVFIVKATPEQQMIATSIIEAFTASYAARAEKAEELTDPLATRMNDLNAQISTIRENKKTNPNFNDSNLDNLARTREMILAEIQWIETRFNLD